MRFGCETEERGCGTRVACVLRGGTGVHVGAPSRRAPAKNQSILIGKRRGNRPETKTFHRGVSCGAGGCFRRVALPPRSKADRGPHAVRHRPQIRVMVVRGTTSRLWGGPARGGAGRRCVDRLNLRSPRAVAMVSPCVARSRRVRRG